MTRRVRCSVLRFWVAYAPLAFIPMIAQGASPSRLEVIPVKGNVYLIAGQGIPNIAMQVGE